MAASASSSHRRWLSPNLAGTLGDGRPFGGLILVGMATWLPVAAERSRIEALRLVARLLPCWRRLSSGRSRIMRRRGGGSSREGARPDTRLTASQSDRKLLALAEGALARVSSVGNHRSDDRLAAHPSGHVWGLDLGCVACSADLWTIFPLAPGLIGRKAARLRPWRRERLVFFRKHVGSRVELAAAITVIIRHRLSMSQ